MSVLDGLRHSLRRLFRGADVDREHDDEVAFHLELDAMQQGRAGLPPDAARRAANLRFGNRSYMREERRRASVLALVDRIGQDVRYGWRALRHSPAFTIVAVLSLGVGIGANTAIFGLIHILLLAQLPVAHPEELVALQRELPTGGVNPQFSVAELAALRASPVTLTSFSGMMTTIHVGDAAENNPIEMVDGDFFSVIGLRAQRGRLFTPADDDASAGTIVVSDRFWRVRLNADPDAVGRAVTINDHRFTVVGVTPADYHGLRFPGTFDAAITFAGARGAGLIPATNPVGQFAFVVGRRPHALDVARAQAALVPVYDRCCAAGQLRLGKPGPPGTAAPKFQVTDISHGMTNAKLDLRGQYSRILLSLMGGVAVLLLVACANVGSLMLARATARERELAVRLSLGASRSRLVTQLLVESLELALLGAAAGVALSAWGTSLLIRALPSNLEWFAPYMHARPNPLILGFTLGVSVLCAFLFGVLPAFRATRVDLVTPLKEGGRRGRAGRGLLDRGVVAVQVALALLLVTSAALLVGTLRNLRETELGFDSSHLLLATAETRGTPYEKQLMTRTMANEMLQRIRALPGVRSAAMTSDAPISGGRVSANRLVAAGGAVLDEREQVELLAVTPGYFATTGITLRAGRDFTKQDASSTNTVIVNQAFVKQYFSDRNPIGQTFSVGFRDVTVLTIVGVVDDARYHDVRAPADPMYYLPVDNDDWPFLIAVVRATGDPASLASSVARAISDIAPGIVVRRPGTMEAALDEALARERLTAVLATLFGVVALGLAAIGVYGVMAYNVAGRTVEIGVRMALGANGGSVMWLVLRQSLFVVGIGAVAGLPLALLAGRSLASQLYGVSPYDVPVLAGAIVTLVLVGVAASLLPARRAVTVDPLVALRAD